MRTFFDELVLRMNQFSPSYCGLYSTIHTKSIWNRSELEKWANLCKESLNMVSDPLIKENIVAESIFPQFALCSLFESSYGATTLRTMRVNFKNDADSLHIVMTKDSNATSNSITEKYYKPWGLVS